MLQLEILHSLHLFLESRNSFGKGSFWLTGLKPQEDCALCVLCAAILKDIVFVGLAVPYHLQLIIDSSIYSLTRQLEYADLQLAGRLST